MLISADAIEFAWERQARSREERDFPFESQIRIAFEQMMNSPAFIFEGAWEGGDFAEVAKAVIAGEFEKAGRLIKANAEAYANRLLEEIKRGESDERPLDCAGYFTAMDREGKA